jgi:hypothetical protein
MGMWYVCSSDDWAAFQMYIDAVLTLPVVAENLQDHPFSQFSEEEVDFYLVHDFIWNQNMFLINIAL